MKKVTISIQYDEEKLSAMKLYLGQKNTGLEDWLFHELDSLYSKTVPVGVREFIEMRSGSEPQVLSAQRTKRQKLATASAKTKMTNTESGVNENE